MSMNKDIWIYLCLETYLRNIFGPHFPREIIGQIMIKIYEPIKVKCGFEHSGALINNKVYMWGRNDIGETGLCGPNKIIIPQELSLPLIKSVKCYSKNTYILTYQGECYITGKPRVYPCGTINYKCGKTDLDKLNISNVNKIKQWDVIKIEDRLLYVGPWSVVRRIKYNIEKMKGNENFTIIQIKSKEICSHGDNRYGQLGIGYCCDNEIDSFQKIILQNVIKFDCGEFHTVALTSDHEIFVWGRNSSGCLGLGDFLNKNLPTRLRINDESIISVKCGRDNSMALTMRGDVYFWGRNYPYQIGMSDVAIISSPQKLSLCRIKSIGCGSKHMIAVTASNLIYVWGSNTHGQLGLGDQIDRDEPTLLQITPV